MKKPLSNKVIIYSALLFTSIASLPRLLTRFNDSLMAELIHFYWGDWFTQMLLSCLFCLVLLFSNRRYFSLINQPFTLPTHAKVIAMNVGWLLVFTAIGAALSRYYFKVPGGTFFPLNGYLARFILLQVFVFIELKLLASLYQAQQKQAEIDQLKLANMAMELDGLKAQINPHFLFNALSSLSGVVREDAGKAQQYITHLSKIFRYSLSKPSEGLVTLQQELDELSSYTELMKMRHEDGLQLHIDIPATYRQHLLPQLSLQPLVENALKHNISTVARPLQLYISINNDELIVQNNLQLKKYPELGMGIGLANLANRFRILLQKDIHISNSHHSFTVKLPLATHD